MFPPDNLLIILAISGMLVDERSRSLLIDMIHFDINYFILSNCSKGCNQHSKYRTETKYPCLTVPQYTIQVFPKSNHILQKKAYQSTCKNKYAEMRNEMRKQVNEVDNASRHLMNGTAVFDHWQRCIWSLFILRTRVQIQRAGRRGEGEQMKMYRETESALISVNKGAGQLWGRSQWRSSAKGWMWRRGDERRKNQEVRIRIGIL